MRRYVKGIIALWKLRRILWQSYKTYKAMPERDRIRLQRKAFEERAQALRVQEDMEYIKEKHRD